MEFNFRTRDIINMTGCSRQRLFQYRQGYIDRHGKEHEPILIEEKDFIWSEGKIFYSENVVSTIKSQMRQL